MSDERLIDLESRLMHQEKLLEQLNEVVTEQQSMIERLQRELAALREQFSHVGEEQAEEPPPHY